MNKLIFLLTAVLVVVIAITSNAIQPKPAAALDPNRPLCVLFMTDNGISCNKVDPNSPMAIFASLQTFEQAHRPEAGTNEVGFLNPNGTLNGYVKAEENGTVGYLPILNWHP